MGGCLTQRLCFICIHLRFSRFRVLLRVDFRFSDSSLLLLSVYQSYQIEAGQASSRECASDNPNGIHVDPVD